MSGHILPNPKSRLARRGGCQLANGEHRRPPVRRATHEPGHADPAGEYEGFQASEVERRRLQRSSDAPCRRRVQDALGDALAGRFPAAAPHAPIQSDVRRMSAMRVIRD